MGKHKYSKVVEFLWLRQKSIETLKDRMSKFLDHRKCMGKLKEFSKYKVSKYIRGKTYEISEVW